MRAIFAKFVEARSVPSTLRWTHEQGLTTKLRQRQGGAVGGARFHYGALRCLFSNRTYVGEIAHKGKIHQGQHEPMVERELFDRARALALAKPKLTLEELAAKFGRSAGRYKRLLRLSYLSPSVVDAIIASRQPQHLTNRFLQNLDGLPLSWAEQDQLLLG